MFKHDVSIKRVYTFPPMVPINKADSLGRFESNLISVLAAVETSFKPMFCNVRNSPRQDTYLNFNWRET